MNLLLVGLDHTTAPVDVREQLAFNQADLPAALRQLTTCRDGRPALLDEAAILSTCNRVEIYGAASSASTAREIVGFLERFHGVERERFVASLFFYTGEAVVRHLCATAAGLHSLVLGESQIQGQVRTASETARQVGTLGPVLSQLFRYALTAGKRVRSETLLGSGAASISQAGVELARQRLGQLEDCSVLLVGSGSVSELAVQNLIENGARELMVVNRTYDHGLNLAVRYGARAFTFDDLVTAMAGANIVISSTAAPVAVIQRAHVEQALQARRGNGCPHDMLLIDLAVPRDIAPDVAHVPGVHLYTIDDLQGVVQHTLEQRHAVVTEAERIVEEEVAAFKAWLREQDALPALAALRQRAEATRNAELERAFKRLATLSPEQQQVVEAFSRSLVNKLLHDPTVRTRDAAARGDGGRYAAMLADLFNLS